MCCVSFYCTSELEVWLLSEFFSDLKEHVDALNFSEECFFFVVQSERSEAREEFAR